MTSPLLYAPNLNVPHAFTTRRGGESTGAYAGLNLDDRADDPITVARNRARLAGALGFPATAFARLDQVHGTDVITAAGPGVWVGDALVTAKPGVLLAIGTADCYPLLLADPQAGVLGAAHAGWKGTVGDIAGQVVGAMTRLGADPSRIHAAVGPGICGERFEVGEDVAEKFRAAGLGEFILQGQGRARIDLAGANAFLLRRAGVTDVWVSGRCSTEDDFYSYRRDAGQTGRMWAVIGLPGEQA
ncbi:peptidoglycan editing factor PgeF [Deinococcus fonticola]|uniref:peptidoglycan editing factor PgeF n=1 Tax=Deinococcus fonticola TaxID=2528713 RepID=UPI0010751282|nr:peptidoglycan editing factor PgeF [Deinococcus fonticola]